MLNTNIEVRLWQITIKEMSMVYHKRYQYRNKQYYKEYNLRPSFYLGKQSHQFTFAAPVIFGLVNFL